MNTRMIAILIRKDVRLVLLPVLLYLLVGAAAIGMMGIAGEGWFYAGSVLLITALIALGFHPAMATVIGERKDQTLAFIMSMPISPTDYTWAKLIANLLLFFIPFALLAGGVVAMNLASPGMPDGLIPYSAILFCYLAACAMLILAVAIVSESMQWTIIIQVMCNLGLQGIMYGASHMESVKATMLGDTVVWSTPVLLFIGIELALPLLALAATLWLQSRKTDFI